MVPESTETHLLYIFYKPYLKWIGAFGGTDHIDIVYPNPFTFDKQGILDQNTLLDLAK